MSSMKMQYVSEYFTLKIVTIYNFWVQSNFFSVLKNWPEPMSLEENA